jgi:tRNA pseudouridine55 synthase
MAAPTVSPPWDFAEGERLLIDKPRTWTSFDVVKKIKYQCRIKKIGHAGTLDPLATGLLILCTGKMTKQIERYQAQEKEYVGTLVLGKTTPSVDLETPFDSETAIDHLTEEDLDAARQPLTGEIQQIPPAHSAVQINGQRAYKLARKGQEVVINPRTVTVKEFSFTRMALPEVDFRIVCSKGTYVRSLVRDLGENLGVGAYLHSLCRTRIGTYGLADAYALDEFIALAKV